MQHIHLVYNNSFKKQKVSNKINMKMHFIILENLFRIKSTP